MKMKKKMVLTTVGLFFTTVFAGDFVALINDGSFAIEKPEPPLVPDPNMKIEQPTRFMTTSTCDKYNGSFPGGAPIKSHVISNQSYPKNFCITSADYSKLHRECFELNGKSYMTDYYCFDNSIGASYPFPGSAPSDYYFPLDDPWPNNPNGQSPNY